MPGKHHLYGPSSLQRRMLCPGSARMEAGRPETHSDDADEGTRLHAVMAGADDGEWMNDEQRECVEWAREKVAEIVHEDDADVIDCAFCEDTYELIGHDGSVLCFGTVDLVQRDADGFLCVVDYKFGRNEVPACSENLQMAAYAAMVMQACGEDQCRAAIVQPRLRRVDVYTYTNWPAIVATIEAIVARCKAPDAPCVPGEEQCRYCRGAVDCKELNSYCVVCAVEDEYSAVSRLTAAEMAETWGKWQLAKRYGQALEEAVRAEIEQFGSCGDLTFKQRAGSRAIADPQAAFDRLAAVMDAPQFLKCCKASPSQLEIEYIRLYAERAPSGRMKRGEKARLEREFAEITAGVVQHGESQKIIVKRKEIEA